MEFICFLVVLALIGFFIFKSDYDSQAAELYKLKNFKLQKENPNVRILSYRTDGDYFISYSKDSLTYYEFFRTVSERREAIADHEYNGMKNLNIGKRAYES
ncbi:hypothetical protein Q4524_09140 [Alteromonas stellipolaris]|uniref:hypothetical protein n=1 Tax=Alteromonas stellipolaris TaxID=233316 RepID=UPI0026E1F25B|nr:hypothetical protein [Alteromonas stellipolaris]MDO6538752.1 hypothetical protein [Alteromonas stellipolaris]